MNVKIYRYYPGRDANPYYQSYEVKVQPEDRWTVMDLLEYIADKLDPTLAFYSHSACRHGICGRCGVKVNGKPGLACETVLTGEDITIDPIKPQVVRDLVVRN